MKLTKRLMAMLLMVCMVLSMLPAIALTASAANITSGFMTAPAGTYSKVTDFSTLNTTDTYIIVFGTSAAMSTTQNSNNRSSVSVTVSNNSVTLAASNTVQAIKLVSSGDSSFPWKLNTVSSGVGYLYAPSYNSGTSNYLRTSDTASQAGSNWSISASDIHSTGSGTRRFMKLNGSLVSCYATGSNYPTADLYKLNTSAASHTVTASVSPSGAGSVALGATSVAENGTTTATATANTGYTFSSWSISGTGASLSSTTANPTTITMGTANVTVTANFTAKTAATLTYSENGSTHNHSGTHYVGDSITLTDPNSSTSNGKTFVGWLPSTYALSDTAPTGLLAAGDSYTLSAATNTLYAVYATVEGSGNYSEVTDELTYSLIGVTGTSYSAWTGKTDQSDAVYAGTTAGGNSAIQLNTTSPRGIVSTASGGTLKSVTVTWNSNTSNGRTLNILASNTAYTSSSQVAGATPVGTIVKGTSTTYNFEDDYTYIGFYSGGSAMYFDKIAITWSIGTPSTYSGYTTAPQAQVNPTYTVSVTSGITGGSVSASPATAEEGDTITITATPNTGYELTALTYTPAGGSATNINGTTFSMPAANVTVNATFSEIDYTITKSATNGTITADATANYNDSVSFTVAPNSGYQIDSVTVTDASSNSVTVSGSNGSYSFTMPASNVTITATCSALPTYSYTIYNNGTSVGSGTAASVTAPAAPSPSSIQYTDPDTLTTSTFTFAGWGVQSTAITEPGAYTGTLYAAGETIPLSANDTVIRAIYVNGSGATFTLSLEKDSTTYYVGGRATSSTKYLNAETSAANAAEFGIDVDSGSSYLYFMEDGSKVYVSSTANGADLSYSTTIAGATAWTVTESNGVISFETTASSGRELAINTGASPKRFAAYAGSSTYLYEFTKTGGGGYLTEAGAPYFAVTYHENTNDTVTNMPSNTSVRQGNSYTIPNTVPVCDGYRFDGWATSSSGAVVYAASSLPATISNVNAAVDLYAHWTAVPQATVTFYDADNTTTFDTANVYEGEAPTAPSTNPTKAASGPYYYTFAGWSRTAGGAVEDPMTVIASGESTRAYYPVFTENTATFTLSFSGRTKVATEGSFVSTVLTPVLATTQEGCSTTITGITVTGGTNDSIATVSTTGNVLTVTGVSAGTLTLNVSVAHSGGTTTGTVTVTVIAGSGGAAGGYKLITKDNVGSDVSAYDWTGEYIITARAYGNSEDINNWKVMTFDWTDATTATIGGGSGGDNITGFTLDPASVDDFGVATATTGGVTISALHTGEADYTENPTTTGQGFVFDRITGFSDGTNDITNQYVLVFERVDDVNNYYTIRIKGTNYYLTNSNTSDSGGNGMGGTASPDSIGATLMWHLSWAPSVKPITASASGDTTATPDVLLIESVYTTQQTGNSRAIFYNQAGNGFRAYGNGAYYSNGNSANTQINSGTSAGYNVFLYGKNNPFKSEIVYDGTERNTTTAKIEVPWNYATQAGNSSLLLEGNLDPESYPGWTILNSGIPTWNLVGAYNPDGTTFSSATSISAIAGTENANFNVANWTASDVGKYYVVRINYQVQDSDGVTHDVPQQAMIVVTNSTNTYATVIHEATSQSNTGSYTVPSRIGTTGVDLDAYVRDNYSQIYTDREEVNGLTASQPTVWTYTSQKGYTYTISSSGVVTWDPSLVTQDDVVEIKATAGLSGGGTTATVAEGTYTLYVRQLAYSGEVLATPDASVTEIPFGDTAFAVTLGNFKNNNNDAPGSSTYSINAASEWNWTASTIGGAAVPITRTSTGATIDVTGLATGTQVIVRATNVIATSNVVANTHTVVTITGAIFTVGEDNSLAAVDDSFVLDFDRNAVLDVMANDRNATGATISAIGGTNASMATISGSNITFTVPGGQLTTASYTFTYTLSKSGETDSTATVTVKPASAIYYEDTNTDFFTYTDGTKGKWSEVGADNNWTQSAIDSNDESAIGYDAGANSLTWSAGVSHKANVGKDTSYGTSGASETWPYMQFSFVGNAFTLSMMRNNTTGLIAVYVDGVKVKNVATAYGATGGAYDANADYSGFIYNSADSNYGMPAFCWEDESGTAGSHTVKVQVLYSGAYDHASPKAGNYDVYIDGVTIYNPIVGSTVYNYISFRDTVLETGSLGVPATQAHNYAATLTPASISVGVGYTGTLQLSLTDESATVYSGYTVAYTSDNTSVATVTAAGSLNTTTGVNTATVTGVSAGQVTITATITTPGGTTLTRTATVNVSDTAYTVTYKLPNGDQEVTYATEQITLGSGVTHLTAAELAEYNAHPYVFRGWVPATVADTIQQPGGLLDDGMTLTIDGDRTYYALYTYGTTTDDFRLKTDLTNPLVDGETIVIYETEGTPTNYLLSNQDYSSTWNNFRLGVAAAPADGFVKTNNTNLYWTVEATSGGFYLKDQDGNYLTANDTEGQLVMTSSPDAKAIWNATTTGVSGANSVYIYNSEASPKYLQHYSGYAEFGAYTYDSAWANRNEMQIYVQQPNNLTYTTDLQSTTVRYTVNYYVDGTAIDSEQVVEGANPSFPNVTGAYTELAGYSHDYTFLGWIPAAIAEDTTTAPATIYNSGDTYAVNDVTAFHAVFTYTGAGSAAAGYSLSDSAPEAGDTFIIAAKIDGTYYALNHSRSTTALTITDGAVADTSNVLWKLTAKTNGNYVQTDEETGTDAFKLNSSSTNYNGISDVTTSSNTGAMSFAANGDGFDMYGTYNTGRHLALSASGASVDSSAQTLYIFKYSSTGGSATYYATTLGEAAPITHSYEASITPTSLALHVGETGSVSATLTDNGATVTGATPTYTTSMSSVATVAADGTVTAVANGNATITATFTVGGTDYTATSSVAVTTLATYNVTYMVNGSQYGEIESVVQGNSPSFTAPVYDTSSYNAHAYEFLGWKEGSALSADTTETQTLYVAGNTHVISGNTTYYAVYRYTEGGTATTAVTGLSNGGSGTYVIAANVNGTYYAMSNTFGTKVTGTALGTVPGSTMTTSEASGYAVTIAKSSSGYTISNGSTLLGYSGSSTNFSTDGDTHTYWTITTDTKWSGTYAIRNVDTNTRGLAFNGSQFGAYSTSNNSGYYDVEIIPVGSSGTTYYATTLNVASAHSYVASISPSSITLTAGDDTSVTGTLTDNGIVTSSYTPTYSSSNSSIVTVDSDTGYTVGVAEGSATVTVSYSVDGTTYTATCSVTVNANSSEYAASYAVQSGVTYSGNSRSGNTITLPTAVSIPSTYNAHSYSLVGWTTDNSGTATSGSAEYEPGDEVTITADTTFYPVYSYSAGGSGGGWAKATSIAAGDTVALVCEGVSKELGSISTTSTKYGIGSDYTTTPSGVYTLTVEAGSSSGSYSFKNSSNTYLYWNSGNSLNVNGTKNENTSWTVSFDASGNATILNVATNTRQILWNVGSPRFACYSGQSVGSSYYAVQLYKYTASSGGTTTYTFTLEAADVADNYVGTVTASPASIAIGGNTATLSSTLTNNGTAVSSSNYSVSYAMTSGTAATLSGSTLTSGSSAGTVTVTATFTVSGSTVATATCNVVVTDPSAAVTVNYVGSQSGYVYNWGTRDEVATFLTAPTSSYYTGSYSYATLSAMSGSSTATAAAIYSSALGTAIHNMLTAKQTSTTTYDGTKTLYKYTDSVGSNTSTMSSYYSGTTISNVWDSGSTWNREHTWPNSKGLNGNDENDIMMLRPTSVSENSSRGNKAYGQSSGYYNPNAEVGSSGHDLRGDVARLMLQHLMRWGNTSYFYGTSGVIESRTVLLAWLEADPVDTWEMGRNDAVQRITGVRNVFVDYPELAFILLGESVPSGYTTPSASGIVADATYNNTYNSSYTPVTRSSRVVNPGIEYAVMDTEPVEEAATRGAATRAVGDENTALPVTGAVMLNGIGEISNNDDVMSYLAAYGAQNCLVVPANGAVVFYLTGGSAESKISIGASALNGTGTTLKVYQISAVSGSSATGTVLLEQALASSTEMYFRIQGIAWTGTKSNVLMVRNEGSAPMLLTNLRSVSGTVEGHISTGGDETSSVGNVAATRAVTRGTENELQMVIDSDAILAGIAAVESINEGTFDDETPVTPVDPEPTESEIVLRGNSISLNGQIDVNFYLDIPDELFDDGVYATLDGVKVDFVEGQYGTMVSKKLPAKEMNTKVTLKLYAADGTPLTFKSGSATVTESRYSVQDYLTYVIGHPETYSEDLVKLCKAMSDYGSYTQQALDFDVNNAQPIYLADEIANVTCNGYGYNYTPNTEHISFLGASVVTESETAIRVYLTLNGVGFTATVDGEPAAIQTNERGTFVEIANISAKNLGDPHTIVITNGSESVTISNCSAYSYIQSVLNYADASEDLVLAVKALKLYGDLAAEYFNK